jgi:hypothetical protein
LFVPNQDFGWTHRKNAVGWVFGCNGRNYEFRNEIRINRNGLRNREVEYAKPPGTRRVLVLGDSMTEAVQVSLEETFVSQIERSLEGLAEKVEVINAGCAAYGTDNELLFYRHEGTHYEPDLVMLVLFARNDVIEISKALHPRMSIASSLFPKRYFDLDDNGELVLDTTSVGVVALADEAMYARILGFVRSEFFVVRALERLFLSQDLEAPGENLPKAVITWRAVYAREPDEDVAQAWRLLEQLVAALRDEVLASDAQLLVAIMPSREEVLMALPKDRQPFIARFTNRWDFNQASRLAREMLDRIGVEYVDLLPPLRENARTSGESGYYEVDIHLSSIGHTVVAEVLAQRLMRWIGSGERFAPSERQDGDRSSRAFRSR